MPTAIMGRYKIFAWITKSKTSVLTSVFVTAEADDNLFLSFFLLLYTVSLEENVAHGSLQFSHSSSSKTVNLTVERRAVSSWTMIPFLLTKDRRFFKMTKLLALKISVDFWWTFLNGWLLENLTVQTPDFRWMKFSSMLLSRSLSSTDQMTTALNVIAEVLFWSPVTSLSQKFTWSHGASNDSQQSTRSLRFFGDK